MEECLLTTKNYLLRRIEELALQEEYLRAIFRIEKFDSTTISTNTSVD